MQRISGWSDDGGETWRDIGLNSIWEMITGCQGSTFYSKKNDIVYWAGPLGDYTFIFRNNFWLFESRDKGKTWNKKQKLISGPSGYSSLTEYKGKLCLLTETSKENEFIMAPDRFIFRNLEIDV